MCYLRIFRSLAMCRFAAALPFTSLAGFARDARRLAGRFFAGRFRVARFLRVAVLRRGFARAERLNKDCVAAVC
jgi:hypothetical protein